MPRLTVHEIATFINERQHLARIGTVDADGMPRVLPFWFLEKNRILYFTPRLASVTLANVRRDPRICISVDENEMPYRKVTIRGSATVAHEPGQDDDWRDLYRSICARYVPSDEAERYIQDTIDQQRALLALDLERSETTTWRLPVADEDKTGIWAKRYFQPGTKMARLASEENSTPMYSWAQSSKRPHGTHAR